MATLVKGGKTVRYYDAATGKQREQTFPTKAEARQFRAQVDLDQSRGTFVDPKRGSRKLHEVAQSWLDRHPGSPKTLANYDAVLRNHLLPAFGFRSLSDVANDREGVELWLRNQLRAGMAPGTARLIYTVLVAIINDSIRSGAIHSTRVKGIKLPATQQKADIVFATRKQIEGLAEAMPGDYGFTVYLMRGCGLRLGEALGIAAGDFDFQAGRLRLQRQLGPAGHEYGPLKHRQVGDYRDIPVPEYVVVEAWPDSWSGFDKVSHRTFSNWFNRARDSVGLPGAFTPHMLRHTFASVALASGVPITDVSKWLGHRNINITYAIYGHLVPESFDRARRALDGEWVEA